jgi:hypothetical protein
VSNLLAAEWAVLVAEAAEPEPQAEPQRHALLAAWAELILGYFAGTALAIND